MTGESYGTYDGEFGAVTDFATIAYSSSGTALWTNFYDGPSNLRDSAYAIAVNDAGDVFVTGKSFDMTGLNDFLTIGYSSTGIALWTNRYDTVEDARAIGIATLGSNYVYVTGTAAGFDDHDYLTIAYTSQGVAAWTNRYGGPAVGNYRYDFASAIAVSSNGTVFVTGGSAGTNVPVFPNYYYDYATIAYSSKGTPVWTNRYTLLPLRVDHIAHALAVDGNGDVFVTGQSAGYGRGIDYVTVKYSNAGVPAWTNRYAEGSGDDIPSAIAADLNGNVYVTGRSSGNSYDYATVAYSNDGTELWVHRFSSPNASWDVPNDIATDADGNVFVTGEAYVDWTPDFLTIKYAAPTTPLVITNCIYIPLFPYTGRSLFSFDVTGPAGANVHIQASTNLQTWVTLQTGNLGNGLWRYEDAHFDAWASNIDRRFYRVMRSP